MTSPSRFTARSVDFGRWRSPVRRFWPSPPMLRTVGIAPVRQREEAAFGRIDGIIHAPEYLGAGRSN